MARGHTCATWTGRRCRPCGASTAATRTSITCAGAARTARAWAGEGAGQSGCRGSAVELLSWRWRARWRRRPPVGRGAWRRCWTRFPAQAGARRRCGTGRHLGWRVEPGAAPGEGSACGAHREDAGHAIVPGHFAATPGWRVDRQVGRGRPRAPGELRARCPPTRTRLGRHRMRACARGGCCSRCWPTPREILPACFPVNTPTRNPTPTLAVARDAARRCRTRRVGFSPISAPRT